jgi:hypothetical protein
LEETEKKNIWFHLVVFDYFFTSTNISILHGHVIWV